MQNASMQYRQYASRQCRQNAPVLITETNKETTRDLKYTASSQKSDEPDIVEIRYHLQLIPDLECHTMLFKSRKKQLSMEEVSINP